ncbi:CoA activase [Thiospirochaeta perfilievii]|uniref:CoA activase n=1 Tax=Thiospirochaeta perfilievii TaxID=252967 RepID=A0A5C1QBP9_9SPIO|nr:acyl-CoA dehydratase activase [Thiospirochaeta perfilievii]QEN05493.1 CoA activase [Thiospirochaeta perfilievii]
MKSNKLGIDIGSTTAKVIILDKENKIVFSKYERHNTEIATTILKLLKEAKNELGDEEITASITGTAGMGISEKTGMNFVQEVVASAEVVKQLHPDVRTLIDLGGEDAKIIFFNEDGKPDIRMNGNCAGGTGAFIDQMASLLNRNVTEFNDMAKDSTQTYSVASRCGVFAKTDIQNLISRDIPSSDIVASIYKAVAFQSINSLSRGQDILTKIMFTGGPLTFQPELRKAFLDILEIDKSEVVETNYSELFPAVGAALHNDGVDKTTLSQAIKEIEDIGDDEVNFETRLETLFDSKEQFEEWLERKNQHKVQYVDLKELDKKDVFLGIDSGSTTTKIVLINDEGKIAAKHYSNNNGNPIQAVNLGLNKIFQEIKDANIEINIKRSAVTGYGEDLIHYAYGLDDGLVETIAHYTAAAFFEPNVSFIMDIGGQDMKAIYCKGGIINNLELNEACSSGCGSFIETFAQNLNENVAGFAEQACYSKAPCDLGTRCTVFMNSKVKQSLREGATKGDIAAGLAISVVKNAFNKVLKLTDYSLLGDNIVVQGGTFKNPAVLRSLEKQVGKEVVRPDISELMGAYGSALVAKKKFYEEKSTTTFIGFDNLEKALDYNRKSSVCRGCENLCTVTTLTYQGKKSFFTGNKCEKIFSNQLKGSYKGENLHEIKKRLLFDRKLEPEGEPLLNIGIPRVLNMWEDFPFWSTLFVESGIKVTLSPPSTMPLAEKGYGTVMSENICFPAKIVNGHIYELIEEKVDRIFYPMVRYNRTENETSQNNYNCPVVTGYPEVIQSSVKPEEKFGIPFDNIPFSFNSPEVIEKSTWEYLSQFGVKKDVFKKALKKAEEAYQTYKEDVIKEGQRIVDAAERDGRLVIMLLGRPYHVDSLVNHKAPEMITAIGVDVITEDCIPEEDRSDMHQDVHVLSQWTLPNRIYDSAIWAGERDNIEVVQLNSFGCGPDAIVVDEVKPILNVFGKNPTVLRIDEISSPGSVKLRIRSLIESMKMRGENYIREHKPRVVLPLFDKLDVKRRTILAPQFSNFYTRYLTAAFELDGYKFEVLPEPDKSSIEIGLKYTNNDICYPATIVIGDLIKALESGKYNPDEVAVGLTQTGGQCRASSYASLLKRGLVNAGFHDVPVITVSTSTSKPLNLQPGFQVSPVKFTYTSFFGSLFGDCLSKLFYRTAVREKNKGDAQKLVDKYIELSYPLLKIGKHGKLFNLLEQCVNEFNQIEVDPTELPKVGIVGEIYVKFNDFSNGYINNWLMSKGIEVEVTPLITFFLKSFVAKPFNSDFNILPKSKVYLKALKAAENVCYSFIGRANAILSNYHLGMSPIHHIQDIGETAEKVLSINHQYGEAWLVAGEIGTYVKDGINDVVCLQPFGCIANHIVAKGVEKKLKEVHPHLNLLFLDMDAGTSEVNTANRLEFLIKGAKESMAAKV